MSGLLAELGVILAKGGIVMPPLVVCALLLWWGLGHRFVLLFSGDRRSTRALVRAAESGRLTEPRGVVAEASAALVALLKRAPPNLGHHMKETLQPARDRLGAWAGICDATVRAAPLLGLLGTVSGMIETFDHLGDLAGSNQAGGVAGGISEALFSTQLGLVVAIPGLLLGRLLVRRQRHLEDELRKLEEYLLGEHAVEEVKA